jgi:pyruvate, water dikinase
VATIPVWVSSQVVPIRLLCEISSAEVSYAGGKGAHLGQLTRTGLPVPPGFVVGAPAYSAFRVRTGLAARLQTLLEGVDVDDPAALEQAGDEATRAIEETELPDWLEQAIGTAHKWLVGDEADAAVAVRSSSTAVDSASMWFAGVNQTFLNVHGLGAVVDMVKRCWMSLFSVETIRYRAERGFGEGDMDIAVVVQLQVAATRTGVMFTSEAATHARDQLVIERSSGFGGSLISGRIAPDPGREQPDRYLVDKQRMSVVERPSGDPPVLTDDEVFRLAELGVAIEREYRSSQEIEWVVDRDGRIWLLQSRPMLVEAAAL